ncbi:MAG: hypothetical protein KGS72_01165 [Cyanobacteria bacterium REEB67]|nr:hypothetical protein [Cyanobacteria bacterium REEB67]
MPGLLVVTESLYKLLPAMCIALALASPGHGQDSKPNLIRPKLEFPSPKSKPTTAVQKYEARIAAEYFGSEIFNGTAMTLKVCGEPSLWKASRRHRRLCAIRFTGHAWRREQDFVYRLEIPDRHARLVGKTINPRQINRLIAQKRAARFKPALIAVQDCFKTSTRILTPEEADRLRSLLENADRMAMPQVDLSDNYGGVIYDKPTTTIELLRCGSYKVFLRTNAEPALQNIQNELRSLLPLPETK